MADEHSKPEPRSGEGNEGASFPERHMRVRAGRYEYPSRQCDPYPRFGRNIIVPQLYLKGRWLEQAGFTLHAQGRIVVSWGRLVIEVQGAAE